ncbi:hypothetical protein C8R43DRAFT_958457 [Mycena crocata]|nr:hypothetical protein C8R43DRAFT_958457 [Mycena crocata]
MPTSPADTSVPSSSRELDSLVSLLQGLSKMSLTMAQNCLEAQTQLPGLFNAAVNAATTAVLEGLEPIEVTENWVEAVARHPDEVDAAHPPGTGDDLTYHVVTCGREPGLYSSVMPSAEANLQVVGVPDNDRLKQRGRVAALAYYRHMHTSGLVHKMVPETDFGDAAATTASRSAPVPVARGGPSSSTPAPVARAAGRAPTAAFSSSAPQ